MRLFENEGKTGIAEEELTQEANFTFCCNIGPLKKEKSIFFSKKNFHGT